MRRFREPEILPVRATLVTRHDFSKPVDLEPSDVYSLKEVISIALIDTAKTPVQFPVDVSPTSAIVRQCYFRLERAKIVEQKNGKRHIVAVYEECL